MCPLGNKPHANHSKYTSIELAKQKQNEGMKHTIVKNTKYYHNNYQ
jgi:hypothetical protein